ncbi:MAG: ribosome recycling factor [Candidatus Marinimicrobia bacterium]|nr:ribosome recycling factor [Candidatus Neomarinimicrobiota bacterium]
MVNEIFKDTQGKMSKVIEHYRNEVASIRTGRANPGLVDSIKVDYYGSISPLKNIAQISTPEAQVIIIQPFDPSSLDLITKAITSSDLGFTPNNDGQIVRINIPPLTEDRRKEYVKLAHNMIEDGRVAIRNARREANDSLKRLNKEHELSDDNLKRAMDDVQEMTDKNIKQLNLILENKEKEILH